MGLEEYKKKRRFNETPEPAGEVKKSHGNSFVIQKHHATRLHYEFRLEMEGVLRSWAIPKGPSLDPSEKRLAMLTEDHPIDYGGFEGIIPKGNYGAGNVIIWDNGTYDMFDPATPEIGWKKGKFHFVLHGKKLSGEWVLVRGSRDPKQWIFFKVRDEYADAETDITETHPESIVSGRLVDDMASAKDAKQWVTSIERELEKYDMKKAGPVALPKITQPMLATLSEKVFDSKDWIFELKLDGMRALVVKNRQKVEMWTRNGKTLTHRFPTLASAITALPVETVILDGEIVALDEKGHSHFNLIQPRIHLSRAKDIEAADKQIPVYFYAFDLLYLNGYNLMKFPLVQRKAVLQKLVEMHKGWIRFADHVEETGVSFFNVVAKHGLEGMVAKFKNSEYQQARSKYWLKIKTQYTDHFVVGGFTPPEGSRKYFGALLVGLYNNGDLIYVGRSGGGFDDQTLVESMKELKPLETKKCPFKEVPAEVRRSTWVQPQLVCEIRFGEWTPDKKLRAPIFQGFRDDIDPKQCRLDDSLPEQREEETGEMGSAPRWKREKPISKRSSSRERTALISPVSPSPRSQHKIEFTNLDKIFWPEHGYTKG